MRPVYGYSVAPAEEHLPKQDDASSSSRSSSNYKTVCLRLLNILALITFEAFVIYALVVSNTSDVQSACAPNLWNLVLAHCVTGVGLFLVILIFTAGLAYCCFGGGDSVDAAIGLPIIFAGVTGLVLLFYAIAFLSWGSPLVVSALNSQTCVDALSAVSATRSPLLAIVAALFLMGDAVLIVGGICFALLVGQ